MSEKLIKELREWRNKTMSNRSPQYYEHIMAWNKEHDREFDEILSRHEKDTDIVKSAIKRCAKCGEEDVVVNVCAKCLSAKDMDPLAVLADRKGMCAIEILPPTKTVDTWDIELCRELDDEADGIQREITFEAPTFAAAEAAARKYLEGLEDKKI